MATKPSTFPTASSTTVTRKPMGEEGLLDVRILAAVEQSLETGETVSLPPVQRRRRVQADQALELKPAKEPSEDDMISIIPQAAS